MYHDQKKFIPRPPTLTNSESRVLCKQKNSEKFLPQIQCDQEKLVLRHHLWEMQSPECSVIKKF